MFIVVDMRDTVRIPPHAFNSELLAVSAALDEKYSNKARAKSVDSMCTDEGAEVYPGDGAAHAKVSFRLVVFRPFLGEVLTGKIKSCNETGLQVSLKFFDDIFVFSPMLQNPSVFDAKDGIWYWMFNGHRLPMDPTDSNDEIRFRVKAVQFPAQTQRRNFGSSAADAEGDAPPMQIMASVCEPGLGMLSWWTSTEAPESVGEVEGEEPKKDDA